MAKTTEEKVKTAAAALAEAKEVEGDTAANAVRSAKKAVKRAKRRARVESAVDAKRADYDKRQVANAEKIKEKAAKKKAAEESAFNAAAEAAAAPEGE
jgi:hypothetical protein